MRSQFDIAMTLRVALVTLKLVKEDSLLEQGT